MAVQSNAEKCGNVCSADGSVTAMQIPLEGGALEALSNALGAACLRDLPAVHHVRVALAAQSTARDLSGGGLQLHTEPDARPTPKACEIAMFLQCWPGAGLGYETTPGVPTRAYTVIVHCPAAACRAVYFGVSGRLAYLIPDALAADEAFESCIAQQRMPDVIRAAKLGWSLASTQIPY